MSSKILSICTIIIAFTLTSCSLIPAQSSSTIDSVNVDASRLAIKGYDPVAYFTQSAPVEGSAQYTAEYQGAVYRFANAQHKDLFESAPEKYAPQYGGYCAFGVTQEKKYDIDPTTWAVVDGKLYLNLNGGAQRVWNRDRSGNIDSADLIWTDIATKSVSEL